MSNDDIAAAVLECVGGVPNVMSSSLCATRLRISLAQSQQVDRNALHSINGVLGIAERGATGIEVVFGPNLVRGVFNSFKRLTGPAQPDERNNESPIRPAANFQVTITPETPGAPTIQMAVPHPTVTPTPVEDTDTNALLEMLDDTTEDAEDEDTLDSSEFDLGPRLLVINGPNINMIGTGGSKLYGNEDFSALLDLCHTSALEAGFAECECYQSNHEGDLIDHVQDAYDLFDAIVINPGGYAHTSVALMDALSFVQIPAIEVHLTKTSTDPMRSVSLVSESCMMTIEGLGVEGYRKAIFELAEHLGIRQS